MTTIPVAATIDEVLAQLDFHIARFREEKDRNGYFAVLYRNVTQKVKEGIAAGRFQDGPRMERLDVNFANRYLSSLNHFLIHEDASNCWSVAFRAAHLWPPLILQHLLLGMNAHINFDLGAAAAITCPGDELASLEHDFNEINVILKSMIDDVQNKIALVSPWMGLLDRVGGRTEEMICGFCLTEARDIAWDWAKRLSYLTPAQMNLELQKLDQEIAFIAKPIRNPGWLIRSALIPIRIAETKSVRKIIDALA